MYFKAFIFLTVAVMCVSSVCDHGEQLKQYTRVKRGKYYSSPPIRIYNRPPTPMLIKGPFSYTPPPFMVDNEPPYPGNRPYKVSKRPPSPTNDGLGDDDITNLVKYLSKQDLDKILDFAQGKDQSNKYRDIYNTNEYNRPYKRENRYTYKGGVNTRYEEPMPYKEDSKFSNFVTEPNYVKYFDVQESTRPERVKFEDRPYHPSTFDSDSIPPNQRIPNNADSLSPNQVYISSEVPVNFPATNQEKGPSYIFNQEPLNTEYKYSQSVPSSVKNLAQSQDYGNTQVITGPTSNPFFAESKEEEKLPLPDNMREEDFDASYTHNVPKVVNAESYDVENFGDLPLMDYSSKLHDVSSYHVPHYTVTQPKQLTSSSFSSSSSSSSTLLKPSPAAAGIKEPVYEPAPPLSAASEQSDSHLKAVKIWSYKSQGAAYTLHDDGSLSPERNRPKYG